MARVSRTRLGLVVLSATLVTAAVTLGLASFGGAGSKTLGASLNVDPNSSNTVGASLNVNGTIDDHGTAYHFSLNANESTTQAGEGGVTFFLNGTALGLCTVHGPGAEPSSFPLTQVQCGGAGAQAVSMTGCKAEIEAHGFSHSDFPREAIYLGTMTVDVKFLKKGPSSGEMKVTVYTPKRAITVDGPVTFNGPASMSTCP